MTTPPENHTNVSAAHLNAAVEALGKIMLEMGRRRLLLRPHSDAEKQLLNRNVRSDADLLELSSQAFEAGVLELTRTGYPTTAVHSCNPDELNQPSDET